MPEKRVRDRAKKDAKAGKAATTQAGEFVREEVHHVREGKHGARSPQQAVAIGLSKARRAGVDLRPPKAGTVSERTRRSAERAYALGHGAAPKRPSARRKRATTKALEHEGSAAASTASLARQARTAAARRSPVQRSLAARKAVKTKGPAVLQTAGRKAARTRKARRSSRASRAQ